MKFLHNVMQSVVSGKIMNVLFKRNEMKSSHIIGAVTTKAPQQKCRSPAFNHGPRSLCSCVNF